MATATPATIPSCCLRYSLWSGTPTGTETTIPGVPNPTYVARPASSPTSSDPKTAILIIADMLGWTFPNVRLLADAFARELHTAVYVPDFFGGEVLPWDDILAGRFDRIDVAGFTQRNGRPVREPEILAFARALRGMYDKLGAVGYCYGGWAVCRLGAGEFKGEMGGRGLVDCVSMGHPSWVVEEDVRGVEVPMQVLAPERDRVFTEEMKVFTCGVMIRKGVAFEYRHFPGVEHGCLVRGDKDKEGEREAMEKGKDAVVEWMKQWLGE
ncbi:hypothetical protein VTI74DRAFT_9181 [Chaetomium olivicolor]